MRKPLTNSVMLAAARRRLAEHLDTRPATAEEAVAICEHYIGLAQDFHMKATDLRCIGDLTNADLASSLGRLMQLHADAWKGDTEVAWSSTKAELEARVVYYAQLCGE